MSVTFLKHLRLPTTPPSSFGAIFALLAAALPLISIGNSKAIVPLTIVAALALIFVAYKNRTLVRIRYFDPIILGGLAAYFLTATVTSMLGSAWPLEIASLGKLFGLIVLAAFLFPLRTNLKDEDIPWVAYALIASLTITMAWITGYILYEKLMYLIGHDPARYNDDYFIRLGKYGYFWFKSAATVLALFSLVAGIFLHRAGKLLPAIALAVCSSLFCYWIGSRTAGFGLLLALLAGVSYQIIGRKRLPLTLGILALAFLMPVWMSVADLKPEQLSAQLDPKSPSSNSVVYRLHIWDFVARKIAEKPLLGWGAGASKRLGTDAVGMLSDPRFGKLGEPIPVHPHNAILQVWLEYGFFGVLFIYVLIARGLIIAERHISAAPQRIWVFACGALIACFFGFSFSIASSWWVVTVIVSVVLAAIFARPAPSTAAQTP